MTANLKCCFGAFGKLSAYDRTRLDHSRILSSQVLHLNQAKSLVGGKHKHCLKTYIKTPFYPLFLTKGQFFTHDTGVTIEDTLSIHWTNRLQQKWKKDGPWNSSIFVWFWRPSSPACRPFCVALFASEVVSAPRSQYECIYIPFQKWKTRPASLHNHSKCFQLLRNICLIGVCSLRLAIFLLMLWETCCPNSTLVQLFCHSNTSSSPISFLPHLLQFFLSGGSASNTLSSWIQRLHHLLLGRRLERLWKPLKVDRLM